VSVRFFPWTGVRIFLGRDSARLRERWTGLVEVSYPCGRQSCVSFSTTQIPSGVHSFPPEVHVRRRMIGCPLSRIGEGFCVGLSFFFQPEFGCFSFSFNGRRS